MLYKQLKDQEEQQERYHQENKELKFKIRKLEKILYGKKWFNITRTMCSFNYFIGFNTL